jgi:TolB protein
MNETEIREQLLDLAADAPKGSTAPPQLLHRARRRVVLTLATSIAVALILVGAGIAGVQALASGEGQPAGEPSVAPSEDPFADVHGWIAYRDGQEIVAVDPAKPNNTLRLGPSSESDPIAWSADGTRLLLRGGMDQDGSLTGTYNLIILSSDDPPTGVPGGWRATWGSFSPDGTQIVYGIEGHFPGPYIIDADGGTPRSLGGRCRDDHLCGEPFAESAAWSPDGSRIAWVDFVEDSSQYGQHAYVLSFVNPDGTGLQREVASLPGGGWSLVWSPDSSRLAFSDWDFFGDRPGQIFVINADGSGLRQITNDGDNRWPTWSPDGSRIAFVRFPGYNAPEGTLYTMASDGTDMQEVAGVHPDGAIAWNPVG